MGMLELSFLNEIAYDAHKLSASHVMTELSNKIKFLLKPNSDDKTLRDSIDMSLIIIDYENLTLQFCGAQSLMIIIREGNHQNLSGQTDNMKIFYD